MDGCGRVWEGVEGWASFHLAWKLKTSRLFDAIDPHLSAFRRRRRRRRERALLFAKECTLPESLPPGFAVGAQMQWQLGRVPLKVPTTLVWVSP